MLLFADVRLVFTVSCHKRFGAHHHQISISLLCVVLQHIVAYCSILQHIVAYCSIVSKYCMIVLRRSVYMITYVHCCIVSHCNKLAQRLDLQYIILLVCHRCRSIRRPASDDGFKDARKRKLYLMKLIGLGWIR